MVQWQGEAWQSIGKAQHSEALYAARSPLPQRHGSEQQGIGSVKLGNGNA